MKLSVSLSWRDEMNFYRERSMLSDNSLGCFVNLYFYSKILLLIKLSLSRLFFP